MNDNPYVYLRAAAHGDVLGQRALADLALCRFNSGEAANVLLDGLNFARLAFANSDAKEDAGRLIKLLALASVAHNRDEDRDLRDALEAECLAVVTRCADAGDEDAAARVANDLERFGLKLKTLAFRFDRAH